MNDSLPTGPMVLIILLLLLVFFIIFMLLREFFTWYWKQTKIVSLLESIDEKLSRLTPGKSGNAVSEKSPDDFIS